MNILIVGASGMIGSTMLRVLSEHTHWRVFGTVRNGQVKRFFSPALRKCLRENIDVLCQDVLVNILNEIRPDIVINCAGLTKHQVDAENPLVALPINALAPHRLAALCQMVGARLIHISTDCVFSGGKGNYGEDEPPDASDVYGKSKALGEVSSSHALTLRTSTIGHELQSAYGLLDWFLSQEKACKGYTRAIFSGLPTVVFAQVVRDVVIPRGDLSGLYHVAAAPITKFDLLKLIADVYGKSIDIIPDETLRIDRSLNGRRFQEATGYITPEWMDLIRCMHACQ